MNSLAQFVECEEKMKNRNKGMLANKQSMVLGPSSQPPPMTIEVFSEKGHLARDQSPDQLLLMLVSASVVLIIELSVCCNVVLR